MAATVASWMATGKLVDIALTGIEVVMLYFTIGALADLWKDWPRAMLPLFTPALTICPPIPMPPGGAPIQTNACAVCAGGPVTFEDGPWKWRCSPECVTVGQPPNDFNVVDRFDVSAVNTTTNQSCKYSTQDFNLGGRLNITPNLCKA